MTAREPTDALPKRLGLIALAGFATILLVALVFVLKQTANPTAASLALDRKLAQLRKDAAPLTPMEIGKVVPDPDAEHDARLLLQPAFSSLSPGRSVTTNIPIVSGGSFPKRNERVYAEAMRDIALFLTNSDALLSAMPTQYDGVWFSVGWTNGFTNAAALPFVPVRQLAQTLGLKAFYEAANQNPEKAAECLEKGFGLTRTLNGDSLVSTMIRVAVAGLMCDVAQQVFNRTKLTDAQLLRIHRNIDPSLADDFTKTYLIERHMAVSFLDPIRAEFQKGGVKRTKLTLALIWQWLRGNRKPIYRDEDYLLYLNTVEQRQAAQSLTGIERVKKAESLDASYKTNLQSSSAELISPHWAKATRAAVEMRARMENVRVAIAVERYRLAHHDDLPDSLAALAPEYLAAVPRDPLDDQPLRFKKLSAGYVIYSVGADGVDNGGMEGTYPYATTNYDVTFTVER